MHIDCVGICQSAQPVSAKAAFGWGSWEKVHAWESSGTAASIESLDEHGTDQVAVINLRKEDSTGLKHMAFLAQEAGAAAVLFVGPTPSSTKRDPDPGVKIPVVFITLEPKDHNALFQSLEGPHTGRATIRLKKSRHDDDTKTYYDEIKEGSVKQWARDIVEAETDQDTTKEKLSNLEKRRKNLVHLKEVLFPQQHLAGSPSGKATVLEKEGFEIVETCNQLLRDEVHRSDRRGEDCESIENKYGPANVQTWRLKITLVVSRQDLAGLPRRIRFIDCPVSLSGRCFLREALQQHCSTAAADLCSLLLL